jgi:hypothetical protein
LLNSDALPDNIAQRIARKHYQSTFFISQKVRAVIGKRWGKQYPDDEERVKVDEVQYWIASVSPDTSAIEEKRQ